MVTLSIVNYVVHHSNGGAFERGGDDEPVKSAISDRVVEKMSRLSPDAT